jgi:tetratricopeptide (TPR) repeat protein
MRLILLAWLFLLGAMAAGAEAAQKRVALVIGQNAYVNFRKLDNPAPDAQSMAELLSANGFEIISCDGKTPGCFDLDRASLLAALHTLKARAAGADMALIFYAGHGVATEEGNMLPPIDASLDCKTGAIAKGVPVELLMQAAAPARHKFVILDACRDNPLRDICPRLKGKKLSFTRIEAGAMQGLLLVTATQFGQTSLDGAPDAHSPFAASLLAALAANRTVFFEHVMNEAARATYNEAQKLSPGFPQFPGKVVGGAAPQDCLAGRKCVGDARMAALSAENEKLAADCSSVRAILAYEEKARGKPYALEERKARVAALEAMLASIGKSADPLRQDGGRLLEEGDVAGGQAKLDEALDADEKAIAKTERVTAERRKAAAQGASDLAVLVTGRDAQKALDYLRRAAKLDASDAGTWGDLAKAAGEAGRADEAKAAYEQATQKARASGDNFNEFLGHMGLGDIEHAQGDLPSALGDFRSGEKIAGAAARAQPDDMQWQRDLAVSQEKVGDVLKDQGNLPEALDAFRDSLAIRDGLAKADPGNARWQRDLSESYDRVDDVLKEQGNLPDATRAFRNSLARRDRLARADPGNAQLQVDLAFSYWRLARYGDKPAENWRKFVDILQKLEDEGNLAPRYKGWLDRAKAQIGAQEK